MELQVTITLSDRLFSLLEDKLPNLGHRVGKAISEELSAQTRKESNANVGVTVSQTLKPTENKKDEIDTPSIAPVGKKNPTESDVRDAMHRMRARFIEGYDRENTDTESESYKKYFRQLQDETAAIIMETTRGKSKRMADIPAETRGKAIEAFDSVTKGPAGELVSHAPIDV